MYLVPAVCAVKVVLCSEPSSKVRNVPVFQFKRILYDIQYAKPISIY